MVYLGKALRALCLATEAAACFYRYLSAVYYRHRGDTLRLPASDEFTFRLRNIGQQLEHDICDQRS